MARTATGLPVLLSEGAYVAFVPPQLDVPRNSIVAEVLSDDSDTFEVSFEGMTHEEAEQLVGCHCLMKRSDIPAELLEAGEDPLVGWKVLDDSGTEIGPIVEIIENPGQTLVRVERANGEEVLIPLVDEFIVSLDEDVEEIVMSLPQGLLEL